MDTGDVARRLPGGGVSAPTEGTTVPNEIPSLLGPVSVHLVNEVGDEDNCGDWSHEKREIRIRKSLPHTVIWHTFYHQQMHMILEDSGVAQLLTKKLDEAICDAFATYRVATTLAGGPPDESGAGSDIDQLVRGDDTRGPSSRL